MAFPASILMGTVLLAAVPAEAQDSLPSHITELFDAYVDLPVTLVPVLRSVTDEKSATSAAPRLRVELTKLYHVREALKKVSSLTPQQSELVRKRYEKDMREQWGKVYTEIFRLRQQKCYGSSEFASLYRIMCMMLDK
ncbi:MAG: hypothetical protein IJ498_03310 [Akkermansia sp.]|nr:hypothetical protein [Akkermansia sp.]